MLICLFLLLPSLTLQAGDLSPHIRPEKYDLLLDTDFDTWNYSGNLTIKLLVLKETDEIKLHARQSLNITLLRIEDPYYKFNHPLNYLTAKVESLVEVVKEPWVLFECQPCSNHRLNAAKDLMVIKLRTPIKPGRYLIKSNFSGVVSSKLTGYYRTGYTMKHTGKYIKMASTHLSPDKARSVFPCFDEPQFRAVFALTIIHPNTLIATSNMPIRKETVIDSSRTATSFLDTPSMSTYLLAWVQHNFVFEEQTHQGVRMRDYARPAFRSVISEKIELVGKSVKFYNEFFGIPFPLPKMDTIGIPNYLVGGMENWGLITMSESSALSRKGQRFGSGEISFRNLFAHEVSHMWFGNLVTMYWWDDLWLKEGMASYLSYPCAGALYHDVDMMDQFMVNVWQTATFADNMITSHPVQMPIRVTSEITQIFDSITYKKGATVLAMLKDVMGEDNFKRGMSHFLDTYKYSTARYRDLLTSMTRFSDDGAKLKHFMDTYILQKNYPLLTLEVLSETKVRLVQSRYVRDSGMSIENDASPFNYTWYVPITLKTDKLDYSTSENILMTRKELILTLPQPFQWIKLNTGGKHLYVTHYPTKTLEIILKQVKTSASQIPKLQTLDHRDRGHVICDLFNAAQLNLVPYSTAFEAAKYLREEKHYLPWSLTYKYLRNIRDMIDEDLANCYRKYVVHLLVAQYQEVKVAKTTLVEQLKYEVFMKFARYIKSQRKSASYDEDDLHNLIRDYIAASPRARTDINLLVSTTDAAQIDLIGNTLLQHLSTSVSSIIRFIYHYSNQTPEAVWRVYKKNYSVYNDKYGLAQFEYAYALKTMIKAQRDSSVISEIEEFFRTHSARAGKLGVMNGLEEAKFTSKFKKDSEPELRKYLESQDFCQNIEK